MLSNRLSRPWKTNMRSKLTTWWRNSTASSLDENSIWRQRNRLMKGSKVQWYSYRSKTKFSIRRLPCSPTRRSCMRMLASLSSSKYRWIKPRKVRLLCTSRRWLANKSTLIWIQVMKRLLTSRKRSKTRKEFHLISKGWFLPVGNWRMKDIWTNTKFKMTLRFTSSYD